MLRQAAIWRSGAKGSAGLTISLAREGRLGPVALLVKIVTKKIALAKDFPSCGATCARSTLYAWATNDWMEGLMIRTGIGGWTFAPWRGVFFPPKLPQARELEFASRALTSIEINGTFYRTQTPETFRKWADETPDGFVFAVKAPRYATSKKRLADAGESIERFIASGVGELGDKLGPINWQFPPTKKFDAEDVAAFLALLPREAEGRRLRHALEVRHASFQSPEFIALARDAGAAIVYADSDDYPRIEEQTADFTYARLMRSREENETGYAEAELREWAAQAKRWQGGGKGKKSAARDVFVYVISGAKVRAPAAAQALMTLLDD